MQKIAKIYFKSTIRNVNYSNIISRSYSQTTHLIAIKLIQVFAKFGWLKITWGGVTIKILSP